MSAKTDATKEYTKLLDEFADLTDDAGPINSWSGETLERAGELRVRIQAMQEQMDLDPLEIDTYLTQCEIDDEDLVNFLHRKPVSEE